MSPDAVLFPISQPHLNARRFALLAELLADATPVPARLLRLEGDGPSLASALDETASGGVRDILAQPVGLPFSASLMNWLLGVLAHWMTTPAGAGNPIAQPTKGKTS